MAQKNIIVRGAREKNLKNVDITLPRNQLIVITGLSGSGKSSLAFDTIYAEGQRRYVESLSAYARQFLGQLDKPDVDNIEGLSPAISIDQKSTSRNPRSTVATVTEIYDYLRLLFARVGTPYCPVHGNPIMRQSAGQIIENVKNYPEDTKIQILAPVVQNKKGEFKQVFQELSRAGYVRVRVDDVMYELTDDISMDRYKQHNIEVIIDRIVLKEGIHRRLSDSIEAALKLGRGLVDFLVQLPGQEETTYERYSEHFACPDCGFSLPELEPKMFSFNSPMGACPECSGLGMREGYDPELIVPNKREPFLSELMRVLTSHKENRGDYEKWNRLVSNLGKYWGLDTKASFEKVEKDHLKSIWYGSSDLIPNSQYQEQRWDGIIPILERRYKTAFYEVTKRKLDQLKSSKPCTTCMGGRLNHHALSVKISQKNILQVIQMSILECFEYVQQLPDRLSDTQNKIASQVLKEIQERLRFLKDVGLDYLTLDRSANTLSGGEAQRIRLATQIGSGLTGCLYVLDEPSIGLHQRDNQRLIETLIRLRDLGNTVIVVEHDEDTIRSADWVVEIGPGAGEHGGKIVAEGNVSDFLNSNCLTADYLTGRKEILVPSQRRVPKDKWLKLVNARGNNLKNVTANIPLGAFVAVTGVSGSGKSTLIQDTLFPRLVNEIQRSHKPYEPHDVLEGIEHLDKVIDIDQSPIGRTPRSNPVTYIGAFDVIRELFSLTPDAKLRGYKAGRFSFNIKGGRCESCSGDGLLKIEMHFLPNVYVPCDVCKGKRYNQETLDVKFKGKSISDILEMTIDDACEFFSAIPKLFRKLSTLQEVGLGYLRVGQSATTLSGGEAQRVKLADELSKRSTGSTIYILDEPTTGLHFEDVRKLLVVLHQFVEQGNTVLVIEHNLDVIKTADWAIDLGLEGGNKGGFIVVEGTPEEVAAHPTSYTGKFLKEILVKPQGG